MSKIYTLPKVERLYLRNAVNDLFANGNSFTAFPYRVVYRFLPESDAMQARAAIMAIAPKKRFKHAVDRNHVKRLTREAYRLAKLPLLSNLEQRHMKLEVAFIYLDKQFITFEQTQHRMHQMLTTLQEKAGRVHL